MTTWEKITDFQAPFLMRWMTATPSGVGINALALDMPETMGSGEAACKGFARMLGILWSPMASFSSEVTFIEAISLRDPFASWSQPVQNVKGAGFGGTSHISKSLVWMLMTGHTDAWGRRRLYFPGTSSSWVEGNVLAPDHWDRAQAYGRGFIAALGAEGVYRTATALIYRPAMPGHPNVEFRTAGLRRVLSVRALTYLDRPQGPERW